MSKSNAFETGLMEYVFNGTPFSWDAIGNLYLALHSGDPGEGGNQSTNEVAYTGYARVAVSRDALGWLVTGDTAENVNEIQFGLCTGGTDTASHMSVGTAPSGAGIILYSGALSSPLAVSLNVQPTFAANSLQLQED